MTDSPKDIEEQIHLLGCQALTEAYNLGVDKDPDNKLLDLIEEQEENLATLKQKAYDEGYAKRSQEWADVMKEGIDNVIKLDEVRRQAQKEVLEELLALDGNPTYALKHAKAKLQALEDKE